MPRPDAALTVADPEVRLHLNESPLGPSRLAVEEVSRAARLLNRYPQGLRVDTTRAIARHLGVPAESVLLTNGVDEAVDLVLEQVDSVWCTTPGFVGYRDRAMVAGVPVRPIPLDAAWQPVLSPERFAAGGAVLLAQPGNPTGTLFDRRWVDGVLEHAELVFLDETYRHFATGGESWVPRTRHAGNLLSFISFSKSYGLAGVRVGAVVARHDVIADLSTRQRFDSVDSIALGAVRGTLDDPDYLTELRRYVRQLMPVYADELVSCGVFAEVRPTMANFVLARVGPDHDVADLVADLARRGVRLCDTTSLGLPGWVRVSVGTKESLLTLLTTLEAVAGRYPRAPMSTPIRAEDPQ